MTTPRPRPAIVPPWGADAQSDGGLARLRCARLVVFRDGVVHRALELGSRALTIGRGLNNDVILEDTRVSRHHAQLRYRARRFWLSDLGSTNGTYINGEQVAEQALRDGDTISLGGLELIFKEA